jgi:hypothetical protein
METDEEVVDPTTQAMIEAGVNPETETFVDYFGFAESRNVYLPDGNQYVTIETLNEGARRNYLNKVNRDVRVERASGDAKIRLAAGDDRHALLEQAIVGWNLRRRNERTGDVEPVPFKESELKKFLQNANPKVIDIIEKEVRKDNTWLVGDVTIEDIEKQIAELQELLETKRKEEEGKES